MCECAKLFLNLYLQEEKMKHLIVAFAAGALLLLAVRAQAHCQIPCGIYDDDMRFKMIAEHVTTIEKSMTEITKLAAEEPPNWNQLVRWVNNKDDHAAELTEIVTYYFMAQRIKPPADDDAAAQAKYVKEVTLLHKMVVEAMKCKQTLDTAHCDALRTLLEQFRVSYMGLEAKPAVEEPHTHTEAAAMQAQ
jgi:nickel superoxide dismutase